MKRPYDQDDINAYLMFMILLLILFLGIISKYSN